jgi:chlorobactene glucosyltransferase
MSESVQGQVSVIIPARNEEANIARAVRSVALQEDVREILVVDDQSDDRTPQILESLKGEIPRVRALRINSLPEGWLGKTHAVAVGAGEAAGEWLLFTDADTEHLPGSLHTLLEIAEREHADLLSISPGQETPTWWEKAVIPLVYLKLAGLYHFDQVSDPSSPSAAANGQYLLIRRAMYQRLGGHEAVRSEILEDVELACRVKSAGGRLVFLPGARWARTRMYRSFGAMWRGWTKNLYLLYRRDLRRMFGTVARLWLLDVLPPAAFIFLCIWLAMGRGSVVAVLAVVACLLALLRQWAYGPALAKLGFESRLASYEVLGAALLGLLLVNSAWVHRVSGRVQWKGRNYSTKRTG